MGEQSAYYKELNQNQKRPWFGAPDVILKKLLQISGGS